MSIERTLARAEDVGALTSHDLPDELAAPARASHDLLDGHAVCREPRDDGVPILQSMIAL